LSPISLFAAAATEVLTMRSAHSYLETTSHPVSEVIIDLEASASDWEVAPGRTVRAWTYNGQMPGPTIEANVGDTLVVRLTNRLDEPTTIHWHGIRLPAAMDGTQVVQPLVQPGESFEYRFTVPDAGTFWYHSHHNETVQMERGLYGALVVRDAGDVKVDRERVLMLDDMKLRRNGDFAKFGGWIEEHTGREGDVRLVNGKSDPTLDVAAGQVERWRVINASSARFILLSIGGQEFSIVGTGGGLIEEPVPVRELLLVPGDRADIVVGPFAEGTSLSVNAMPCNRHTGKPKVERFASVRVGTRRDSAAVIPSRMRLIESLATPDATPNRVVTLSESLNLRRGTDFKINGEMHHNDKPVMVGELQVWDVVNASHMDHPFHLHGFFFQVLSVNGVASAFRAWQDTVNVPPKGRVRIAWMPDDRPGFWMYHCHILEHHAGGMMANFAVVRPGEESMAKSMVAHSCHT
jgi:FtsP/CotA-like multicopper oxidase with cupredoxin domain